MAVGGTVAKWPGVLHSPDLLMHMLTRVSQQGTQKGLSVMQLCVCVCVRVFVLGGCLYHR